MVEGEPVVRLEIENYHFETVTTEEKTNEVKVKQKSELEVKIEILEIKK